MSDTAIHHKSKLSEMFSSYPWFQALEPDHRALVVATSRAERVSQDKWVARRGELSDDWLGVHRGLLKLAIYDESGKSCTLSGVPPGGWFGEGSVIKHELRKYDVVAIQPSLVLCVPAATFEALLSASLSFSHFVIGQLNERMGEYIASIQNQRLLQADARVAQSLAQLFNSKLYPSTDLALDLSQEELGYLTGLSRQRVNRALQTLQQQNILVQSYSKIRILDLEQLRSYGRAQL